MLHLFVHHHLQPELDAIRASELERRARRRRLADALPSHPAFARTTTVRMLRALAARLEAGTIPGGPLPVAVEPTATATNRKSRIENLK